MSANSRNFDEQQRGRFYVDAKMLRDNLACDFGYDRYVAVFGTGRHKFNKSFIRKAVNKNLALGWLSYKSDERHTTATEDHYNRSEVEFYSDTDWTSEPTKTQKYKWWVEAFTAAGYI